MQNNPTNPDAGNAETTAPGKRKSRFWPALIIISTVIMAVSLSVLLYTIFAPRPTARKAKDMMEKLDKVDASIEEANTVLKKFDLPPLPNGARNIRIFFWRFLAAGVYLKCEMPPKTGDFYMNRASKGLTFPFNRKAMRKLHVDEIMDWWAPSKIKRGMMHERTWENKEKKIREGLYIYWDAENNILYLHRSWS